jgi:polyisoprenoid-binding protein YceI
MHRISHILFACTTIFFSMGSSVAQDKERTYEFDLDKSTITWVGRKADQKFSGSMKLQSGYITFNDAELTQAVIFADVQSINCKDCGNQENASDILEYVKSKDFLNVSNMDFATFKLYKASKIEDSKDGNYRIEGNLTIIAYSNVISMPVTILEKKDKIFLEGKLSMNRSLWKLNDPKNSDPSTHIGQTIDLYLNFEGEKK